MGEIRENQKAKLIIKPDDGEEKDFDCSIKTVGWDRMSLSFPSSILDYSRYFEEGSEILAKIFTPSGIKVFDSIVINSPCENDFVIEFDENHEEVQRREYLRVEVETKIIIESGRLGGVVTNTIDVSGGGLRFYSDKEFLNGESVKIMLYLPEQESSVKANGKIVKGEHLPENNYVISFTEIEEKERDKIITFCFNFHAELYKQD